MPTNEDLITPEVMANTLKKEVYPEIKIVTPARMGKVRTVYDVGDNKIIMISSDDISTHDVVHRRQVYAKGENLDAISSYYFEKTKHIIPNHYVQTLAPNTWLVQKAQPILVEMVFRKYLTGSGWKAYVEENSPQKGMEFCGVWLRSGYRKNERLDQIIFTPTAKGQVKDFDITDFLGMNLNDDDPKITVEIIKRNYKAFHLKKPEDIDYITDISFRLYNHIHADLELKGELLADTKWEFGYLPDGKIILIDECVTPDSSRLWRAADYQFNPEKKEFSIVQGDKQPFRDYVEKLGLHKPEKKKELAEHWMDDEVLRKGILRYCNIRERITGSLPEISTEPRKRVILETLAAEGYLK